MEVVQLIVECTPNMTRAMEARLFQYGELKYRLPLIGAYVIEVPRKHLQHIRGLDGVFALTECTSINAQMNNARKAVHADHVQKLKLTGHGVGIAILDTGVSPLADFMTPKDRIVAFKDFVSGRSAPYDDNAHGTHDAQAVA